MNYLTHPLRPSAAAIAAVLVLSSAPALAQSADASAPAAPSVSAPAPVLLTPAAPVVASTSTAASAPAAVAPSSPATLQIAPAAPTVSMPSMSTPDATASQKSDNNSVAQVADEAPAKSARHAAKSATPKQATSTPEAAPVAVKETTTPVAAAPLPVPVAPVAKAAPVTQPAATAPASNDETLEIAGAAGAAILVLAGGAFALSRRKRRDEEADVAVFETAEPEPELIREPVAMAVPTPVLAPVCRQTALPAGFDLSRFGAHVQAAYRGPTADNPSLSLATRLKRARFFDQRERAALVADMAPTAVAREPVTIAGSPARETLTVRRTRPARASFRPAYQG